MENESGMPAGEKPKEEWYDQEVICGWCKKKLGVIKNNDPLAKGLASHGICDDCNKKMEEDLQKTEL